MAAQVSPERTYNLVFWTYNVIFMLSGLTVVIVGIWALAAYPGHVSNISDGVRGHSRFFIFVGLFIIAIGSLGCIGKLQKNAELMRYYGILTKLAVGLTLLAAVLSGGNTYVEPSVQSQWENEIIVSYGTEDYITILWAQRHRELNCCGANGPTDFKNNTNKGYTVPRSCCVGDEDDDAFEECKAELESEDGSENLRTQGCYGLWVDMVAGFNKVLVWTAISAVFVQVFGLILSWAMVSSAQQNHRKTVMHY